MLVFISCAPLFVNLYKHFPFRHCRPMGFTYLLFPYTCCLFLANVTLSLRQYLFGELLPPFLVRMSCTGEFVQLSDQAKVFFSSFLNLKLIHSSSQLAFRHCPGQEG
uniref:Uncharacterized protein n=1 Tax=Tetraselmis sp. GSL018 TaxID=582737 RepID=A0A061RSE4_9CHLO